MTPLALEEMKGSGRAWRAKPLRSPSYLNSTGKPIAGGGRSLPNQVLKDFA